MTTTTEAERLPSKPALIAAIIPGIAMMALSIILWVCLLTRLDWSAPSLSYESGTEQNVFEESQGDTNTPWYFWLTPIAPLSVGVTLTVVCYEKFKHYYREVCAGTVTGRDINYYYSIHRVTITGLTRAGETREYTHVVDYDTWHQAEKGAPFPIE